MVNEIDRTVKTYDELVAFYQEHCPLKVMMLSTHNLKKLLERGGSDFIHKLYIPDFSQTFPSPRPKGLFTTRELIKEFESEQAIHYAYDCIPFGSIESHDMIEDENDVYEVQVAAIPQDDLDHNCTAAHNMIGNTCIKWRRFKSPKNFFELGETEFRLMGPGRLMFVDSIWEHDKGGVLDLTGDAKYLSWNTKPTDCAKLLDFIAKYCEFCSSYVDANPRGDLGRKYKSAGAGLVVVFVGGLTQVCLQVCVP